MKPAFSAVAVALCAALPCAALAQGTGLTMPYQSGFWGHAGVQLGGSRLDTDCPPGSGCDDSEQAFRVFGGGRFNNAVGGEVGFIKFGDFKRGGGETDAKGLDLALIAGIPFGTNWSLFGKFGVIYSDTSVTGTATGLRTGSEHGFGPRAGIGLQAGITPNWAVRADLDRFRVKMPGGNDNIDTLMLGAQYTFR